MSCWENDLGMYLWVVLTTFLAMMAAYYLPIRQDTQKILTVPVAQANLMQMIVKQKAGMQFMKENAYPYYSTEGERKVNYSSGEIDVTPYLPFGFVNNQNYVTAIYCMDEDMTQIFVGEEGCQKVEGMNKARILITYGAIPEKWLVITPTDEGYSMRPSIDIIETLREHFGTEEMVGYVMVEGEKLYVVNYEGAKFEIPQPIVQNEGMANYGIKDCMDDYGACLAYMSRR